MVYHIILLSFLYFNNIEHSGNLENKRCSESKICMPFVHLFDDSEKATDPSILCICFVLGFLDHITVFLDGADVPII